MPLLFVRIERPRLSHHNANMEAGDIKAALARHQSGDLVAAERMYRLILESEPENAVALHFLGVCQLQLGRTEPAAELLRRSVELAPANAAAHNHLGAAEAAVMNCLDLVITCDSAVAHLAGAHLAGALGVDTWVALTRTAEWRWLVDREDCPWYPKHRLFRQPRDGDWGTVFQRMKNELLQLPQGLEEALP